MVERKLPLGALWVIFGARSKRLQVRTSITPWLESKKKSVYFDLKIGFVRFSQTLF
jgi:hypothetical protein